MCANITKKINLEYKKGNFYFLTIPAIALVYLVSSSFTFGKRKNNPIMLGKTSPKIIASENPQTEDMSPAAPITINNRNNIL